MRIELALVVMVGFLVSWGVRAFAAEGDIVMRNDGLEVVFGADSKYGLKSVVHRKPGNDLVSAKDVPATLFALEVATGEGSRKLTQADATQVRLLLSDDGSKLTLEYEGLGGLDMRAAVKVEVPAGRSDSTWRLEVSCGEGCGLLSPVRFPMINGCAGLGTSPDDDVFVAPALYGELHQNPYREVSEGKLKTLPAPGHFYPGGLAMQFTALYDERGGFYLACEDTKANIKALAFQADRWKAGVASLSFGHYFPEEDSKRFANDFPIRLAAFDGDWYDAAEMYREWATQQIWCAKRLEEREDYPAWFKEPIPVFDYRNYARKPGWEKLPPDGCEAVAREFIGETKYPYVLFAPGWEKFGPWAGPEFFPPQDGEESLAKAIGALHERGDRFMHMFCCSIWVHPQGQETEPYLKEGAANRLFMKNGEEYNVDKSLGFLGKTHRMCPGTEAWQSRVEKTTEECLRRGFDLYQLDLFPISNPVPCYGKGHPHPMGWGRWFGEGWKELCRRARTTGKQMKPEAVFSAEEMCEIYIPYFETCLTREERRGKVVQDEEATGSFTGIAPIFQYVYHDYITAIGDFAEPTSLGDPKAAIAIAKQFTRAKHIGVRIPTKGEEVTEATLRDREFTLRAVDTLYALGGKRTLFARMIRPPKTMLMTENGTKPVDWRTSAPAIGAFESGGEIIVLLSNASDKKLSVVTQAPREAYAPVKLVANGTALDLQALTKEGGRSYRLEMPARSSMGIVYAPLKEPGK